MRSTKIPGVWISSGSSSPGSTTVRASGSRGTETGVRRGQSQITDRIARQGETLERIGERVQENALNDQGLRDLLGEVGDGDQIDPHPDYTHRTTSRIVAFVTAQTLADVDVVIAEASAARREEQIDWCLLARGFKKR